MNLVEMERNSEELRRIEKDPNLEMRRIEKNKKGSEARNVVQR
jgi:hypothetical protein